MYNDNYRSRFGNIPVAYYADVVGKNCVSYPVDENGNVVFTPAHNHKDFEILLIKSGKAEFRIDDKIFETVAGDIIVVNPYEIHSSIALSCDLPLSFGCFTFDLSVISSLQSHPGVSLAKSLYDGDCEFENIVSDFTDLHELFVKLEKSYVCGNGAWEFMVCGYLYEFFGLLCDGGYIHEKPLVTKNKMFVKKIQQYIEKNFNENITSADAAAELCYDSSYFCRLFKSNFNKSFSEYLNFYRVTKAKSMLKSGMSVSEASTACGFNSTSYFAKKFKKYNLVSPKMFRD